MVNLYKKSAKTAINENTNEINIENGKIVININSLVDSTRSDSDKGEESTSSIENKCIGNYFPAEQRIWDRNKKEEEKKKEKLKNFLTDELRKCLDLFDEEVGELTSAEKKIIDIEHKFSLEMVGDVVQRVYVRDYNNAKYLSGICNALMRYDFEETFPWGQAMLPGFLNHPDERVKEYTIQLIDNWNDITLLPMLEAVQISTKWLRDYINEVIKNLES